MNLFNVINEVFEGGLADVLIAQNDVSKEKAKSALTGLTLAAVLALMKRGSNDNGLKQLFSLTQQKTPDLAIPTVTDWATTLPNFVQQGDKLVQTVTPGAKSAVAMHVSRVAGLPSSVVGHLMGPTMMVAIQILKKEVQTRKTDSTGLANLLAEQSDYVADAAPKYTERVIEALGMQGFAMTAVEPSPPMVEKPAAAPPRQPFITQPAGDDTPPQNWAKWGGAVFLLVVLAALGYYYFQKSTVDKIGKEEMATEVADSAATPAPAAANKQVVAVISPLFNELTGYLGDSAARPNRSFNYSTLDFADNSADLTPAGDSLVKNLGVLLQKYPSTQVKFVAFANDAKLPTTNRQLSSKRAYALKEMLAKAGIDMMRLDAEGKGTGVNPRDTLRKQTPLRMVLIKIVKK